MLTPSSADVYTITNDPIANFPTSSQPISDTMLKGMLLSLRASLQSDILTGIKKCQADVQAIGSRVDHVEQKMGECTCSFNTLVDAHTTQNEEITWLKDKVSDPGGQIKKEQH